MLKIILISILLYLSVYADQLKSLKSIEDKAFVYGLGEKKVYLFIDPWCKYSRKFVSLVSKNPKMLSKYRYYIYLYGIPRLHSKKAIAAVYQSKDPLKTLLDIMLHDDHQTEPVTKATENKIDVIANVAQTLHIHKRPFIIIEK